MSESPRENSSLNATNDAARPGREVDDGRGKVFPCEQCGADLEFHIGQQDLKCPFCGFVKVIDTSELAEVAEQDFHEMFAKVRAWREAGTEDAATGQREVRCDGCGANVVFAGSLTSSECPYCGGPIQRDKVHDSPQRVAAQGVMPFQVEKEQARRKLSEWVRSRWFAPNEFLRRGVEGRFNGVYWPFWTYDSMTFSRYAGERGDHYWVTVQVGNNQTRQERRTRWTRAAGSHQRFFDDVLVLATKQSRGDLVHELAPWPFDALRPFNQETLAGFMARTYEVELEDGFDLARREMEAAIASDVRGLIGGDEQRVHEIKTRYDAVTFKHILLPVWLLAYRYGDKTFQVFVNAATGEVQGERPYSGWKIFFAVMTVLVVIGGFVALQNAR